MNIKKFNQNVICNRYKNVDFKICEFELRQKIQNINVVNDEKNQFQINKRFF